eukprot:14990153-Ditylum_brightwellii.AAC.1
MISYPQNSPKINIDSSLFFIIQQQMKQREDEKALREQQILLACMECKATEQAHKEHESQRERHHQDFMMMVMVMLVTGAKSPVSSISSLSSSKFITPTKGAATEEDELEKEIAKEMVLHNTVLHMKTPPSSVSMMSESEKAQINKIRKTKKYLAENN